MKEIIRRLDGSLRVLAGALGSIRHCILAWLEKDASRAGLSLADGLATERACEAMKRSIRAVIGFVCVFRNPDHYDGRELQSVFREFERRGVRVPELTGDEAGDRPSPHESLADLLQVIERALGLIEGVFEVGVGTLLGRINFTDLDITNASEDLDLHSRMVRHQLGVLRLIVVDLIDPKHRDLVPVVARIESHLTELKSRMTIAANQ